MTFTKEQLIASAHSRIEFAEMMLADNPEPLKERTWSIELELARMALAALESRADAEPVAWTSQRSLDVRDKITAFTRKKSADAYGEKVCWENIVPLYTRPQPAPVVPDEKFQHALFALNETLDDCGDSERGLLLALDKMGIEVGGEDCRAVMLQGVQHENDKK